MSKVTALKQASAQNAPVKKKTLRSNLQQELLVKNTDWRLECFARVLAECEGVDFSYVLHGFPVKGRAVSLDPSDLNYVFRKGSVRDKKTKRIAKFYYDHKEEVFNFLSSLNGLLEKCVQDQTPACVELSIRDRVSTNAKNSVQEMRLSAVDFWDRTTLSELLSTSESGLMYDGLLYNIMRRVAGRHEFDVYVTKHQFRETGIGSELTIHYAFLPCRPSGK